MRAAWYDEQGPAAEVLRVGDIPAPEPGPGEVRVRLHFSGINPGDTKKRVDRFGLGMPFSRVVPHSDGSGVTESAGEGVDVGRVGQRVWVYGAQSYRPFGTAAQLTVVPAEQAVQLPEEVSDEVGACLGIPGITAHRAVFVDGAVTGATVLVHGVLGGVDSLAAQLARWGGAEVIATVRRRSDIAAVDPIVATHVGQRHHPPARERRLPARREAGGGERTDDGSARRRAVNTDWRTAAPRPDRRSARPRRRRCARARAHLAPVGRFALTGPARALVARRGPQRRWR